MSSPTKEWVFSTNAKTKFLIFPILILFLLIISTPAFAAWVCSDSDGGEITSVAGIAVYTHTDNDRTIEYPDACQENGQIKEFYCQNNRVYYRTSNCAAGSVCDNGACVQNEVLCEDSDGGQFINIAGTVNAFYAPYQRFYDYDDACLEDGRINEYFCRDNSAYYRTYSCDEDYVCEDGACIEEEVEDVECESNNDCEGSDVCFEAECMSVYDVHCEIQEIPEICIEYNMTCKQGFCTSRGEVYCDNDFDEDRDGLIDCEDSDCSLVDYCWGCASNDDCEVEGDICWRGICYNRFELPCGRFNNIDCSNLDLTCKQNFCAAENEVNCSNELDEDRDARTDCFDSDCFEDPVCNEQEICGNNRDDDGDGFVDCDDDDCIPRDGCELCVDNDGGRNYSISSNVRHYDYRLARYVVHEDICYGNNGVSEQYCSGNQHNQDTVMCEQGTHCVDGACVPHNENCNNEIDDDNDELIDCFDPDCIPVDGCPECSDTNPDNNKSIRGVVTYFDPDWYNYRTVADGCASALGGVYAIRSTNYYCRDGEMISTEIRCGTDYRCHNGACVPRFEICNNSIDDNYDGSADCADSECSNEVICGAPIEVCDDGLDNNNDQLVDCLDPTCTEDVACIIELEVCDDELDNDKDNRIDCFDSDCDDSDSCVVVNCSDSDGNDEGQVYGEAFHVFANGQTTRTYSDRCSNAGPIQRVVEHRCDRNGEVDYYTIQCADLERGFGYPHRCVDGACIATDEFNCYDGVDNDANGLIDCVDFYCENQEGCLRTEICDNEFDDDFDGLTDCADSDCIQDEVCGGLGDDVEDDESDLANAEVNNFIDFVLGWRELNIINFVGIREDGSAQEWNYQMNSGVVRFGLSDDADATVRLTQETVEELMQNGNIGQSFFDKILEQEIEFEVNREGGFFEELGNLLTGNSIFDIFR
ncbi:hypothetical protein HOK51_08640 [Candidatus Woesearchaeota archaeon]|jgi:hypothetical protein|nr:hypothetical protein [Candidatus Woesearchaeota archaeon]MBT6519894.1 hypothetical protein [Candidatus Woesearchaeota archaeon]